MKLYIVHYIGPLTSGDPSIVSIHKTVEGANAAMKNYHSNMSNNSEDKFTYTIEEINTDVDEDKIYDFERYRI